ncbi:MAG: substrate-binding domain-containing protein, partial [Leptolyngbyaceae bacterium]|nr:substrate-binding domain-containing protein [Leptolyngbyaceae bacterium]
MALSPSSPYRQHLLKSPVYGAFLWVVGSACHPQKCFSSNRVLWRVLFSTALTVFLVVAFPAIAQADSQAPIPPESAFQVAQVTTAEDVSEAVTDELAREVDLISPDAPGAEGAEPRTVKIDGSGLMQPINQALKQRFETEFPGTEVTLDANGTESAIQALLNEDIDLAAIGRSLTDEEKARGLVEVPISQEPIAVIVGRNNPFDGTLTLEQFAQIFRGEIIDWAEVGRSPGSIRLIDRPLNSDTRLVLARYGIVAPGEAATGEQVVRLETDDTAEVIRKLGTDGISYAIASQVEGQRKVKLVKLAVLLDTLPSSQFYPYSQIRGYAYKKASEAEVLPFVSFATGDAGQTAVRDAKSAEAKAIEKELNPPPLVNLVKQKTEKPNGAIAPIASGISWWVWLLVPLAVLFLIFAWGRSQFSTPTAPASQGEPEGEPEAKTNGKVTAPSSLESDSETGSPAPPIEVGIAPTESSVLTSNGGVSLQGERPEGGAMPDTSTESPAVEEKETFGAETVSRASDVDVTDADVTDADVTDASEPGIDETVSVEPALPEPALPEPESPETEPLTLVSADGRVARLGSKILYYWENADLVYRQGVRALDEGDIWVAIACFR